MKLPIEWLKDYVTVNKSPTEIAKSFTALGLMLDKPITGGVLDLEHRMDRSDWLSIVGCARDLAAYESLPLKLPKLHHGKGKKPSPAQIVPITVKCPDLVRRFNTRVFRNIKVKESPVWLKKRLEEYGIQSINNIVDITNFVMVELGQPMHAQDLGRFAKQELVIRRARVGETITTLLGDTVKLDADTFVLTQNDTPVVIGGIVGSRATAVDESTTDILLDAGNYDQAHVRKTSRRLKIQNETVIRYDKFLHPHLTEVALDRATELILTLAGGTYYDNVDWYPKKATFKNMVFPLTRLEQMSGMGYDTKKVIRIIQALGYKILKTTKTSLTIEVPYFRTDVEVVDDIVADILRISDYANIPTSLINQAPPDEITSPIYKFEEKIRDALVSLGFHEHITSPIMESRDNPHQVQLENSFSLDQTALRTSLLDTLSRVTVNYRKHGEEKNQIFEIGNTYSIDGQPDIYESYHETRSIGVFYQNHSDSPYENSQHLKKIFAGLLHTLGLNNLVHKKQEDTVFLFHGNTKVGYIQPQYFELWTEPLFSIPTKLNRIVSGFRNYRTEDLSLLIDLNTPFGPIYQEISRFDKSLVNTEVLEEHLGKGIEKGKKAVLVRITFNEKADVASIKSNLLKSLQSRHGIVTRK